MSTLVERLEDLLHGTPAHLHSGSPWVREACTAMNEAVAALRATTDEEADNSTAARIRRGHLAGAAPPLKKPLACADCSLRYGDPMWADFVLPDAAWNAIAPEGHGIVLCVQCMHRRALAAGIECPGQFTSGPFADHNWRKPPGPLRDAGAVIVETAGFVRMGDDGPYVGWTLEGGIAALEIGQELIVSAATLTDDDGAGEVYLHPAPAQVDEISALRTVAKRNLRSMIERGSSDTKLMLDCLEELS